ncbi:MAG: hypothetical protein CMJ20_12315 [Phycisphaeraceae bacterium]|nr:hypothetical protein [Phycisphaeraceae bacterium]|tara:strand:- start:23 stop:1525 length:1503 start_codon:yes stop_codon:yes gene_type:complete
MTTPTCPPLSRRVTYADDPSSIAVTIFPPEVTTQDLQGFVDHLAAGGVDAYAKDVFSTGVSVYWNSSLTDYDPRPHHKKFLQLINSGIEPLNVYIDRCHQHGMAFLASFRMNDQHWISPAWKNHPEWQLPRGGMSREGMFDYQQIGVQEWMLSLMTEMVERFDIDGLELDWLRALPVFEQFPATPASVDKMTDFIRQIKELLVQRGTARDHSLPLGVRVPTKFKECLAFGLDVKTWIEEGLIDRVTPTDAVYCNFQARYMEDFGSVTSGRDCMLCPSIMPVFDRGVQYYSRGLMSLDNYRALAHSFYQQGANGLNIFNFQYHWRDGKPGSDDSYPTVFSHLQKLREPNEIAGQDRQYLFYPMWHGPWFGFDKNYQLQIPPEIGSRGDFGFRLFESGTSENAKFTMKFAAISKQKTKEKPTSSMIRPHEPLVVALEINGNPVPGDKVIVSMYGDCGASYEFDVNPQWLRAGDNKLTVILLKDHAVLGDITIKNIELDVTMG